MCNFPSPTTATKPTNSWAFSRPCLVRAKAFAVIQAPSRSPPIFLSMVPNASRTSHCHSESRTYNFNSSDVALWHFCLHRFWFFPGRGSKNRSPWARKHMLDMYVTWRRSRVFRRYAAKANFCPCPLKPQTLASLPWAPFRPRMLRKIKRMTASTILTSLAFLSFFFSFFSFFFFFLGILGLWASQLDK